MLLLMLLQVTLNLCLSSGHSGGELYLLGSGGRGDLTVQHRRHSLMISPSWFPPFCSYPKYIPLPAPLHICPLQAGLGTPPQGRGPAWSPAHPGGREDQPDNLAEVRLLSQPSPHHPARNSSLRNLQCPMCCLLPDLEPAAAGQGDGFTLPHE